MNVQQEIIELEQKIAKLKKENPFVEVNSYDENIGDGYFPTMMRKHEIRLIYDPKTVLCVCDNWEVAEKLTKLINNSGGWGKEPPIEDK